MTDPIEKHGAAQADADSHLKSLVEYGAILIGTQSDSSTPQPKADKTFIELLRTRLELLGEKSPQFISSLTNTGDASRVISSAVRVALDLLKAIETEMISNDDLISLNRDILGIKDMRVIHTLLELVIIWGISPMLSKGVGIEISKRIRSGYARRESLDFLQEYRSKIDETKRLNSLILLTTELTRILLHQSKPYTTVSSLLRNRYLLDVCACLLELGYGPADMEEARSYFQGVFERADDYKMLECLTGLLSSPSSPPWLRSVCGTFLSKVLLREKGVQHVIEFMAGDIDGDTGQLDKIARVLMSKPKSVPTVPEYYKYISTQMVELLRTPATSPSIVRSVVFTLSQMTNKYPKLMLQLVAQPILRPFTRYYDVQSLPYNLAEESLPSSLDPVVEPEATLLESLNIIHRLLHGNEPSPVMIHVLLTDAMLALYDAHIICEKANHKMTPLISEIILTYGRIIDVTMAISVIKRILFRKDLPDPQKAGAPYFQISLEGELVLRVKLQDSPAESLQLPIDVDGFVRFLRSMHRHDISGELLLYLLTEYVSVQSSKDTTRPPTEVLLILQVIVTMLDRLDSKILKDPVHLIAFANNVLVRYKDDIERLKLLSRGGYPRESTTPETSLRKEDLGNIVTEDEMLEADINQRVSELELDDETSLGDNEIVVVTATLLLAILSEHKVLPSNAMSLLKSTLDTIQSLQSDIGTDSELGQMFQDIGVTISARQASIEATNAATFRGEQGNSNVAESLRKYQEAMDLLQDDLLPVRAHGLTILREMAMQKDPIVSDGKGLDTVLDLFVKAIQDDDSYIYLNAIKGLSTMSDVYGRRIIEKLVWIYRLSEGNTDNTVQLDKRLRVGEALLQTIQRCGETLGRYGGLQTMTMVSSIVPTLLHVVREERGSPTLRVSGFSLLGSCCHVSVFALREHFATLVSMVLDMLDVEKAPEVRRAGIFLLISLIRGLSSQMLAQYPAHLLSSTYTKLKYVEATDKDDLTRLHARTALSDLSELVPRFE